MEGAAHASSIIALASCRRAALGKMPKHCTQHACAPRQAAAITRLIALAEAIQNRAMNGARPKVEIFKPFGEAFELTKKILFQPFDLRKWCVIGFAAFLCGHFARVGINLPSPFGNFQSHQANQWVIPPQWDQWKPWLQVAIVFFALLVFVFIIVVAWLKARGNFIFTDCVVRNRAAIVEPWREYRKEGNSYFLFLLTVMFGALLLVALMLGSFIALGWLRHRTGETGSITFIGVIVFLVVFWVSMTIFVGVIAYFMVPVMYRRRCRAVEAFRDVTLLIAHHLGSFVLFCLFGIVLVLAVLMIGGIVTCATCCLAALPYVGTVILLPLFVCLRAFGLLFLRQFGSDYDVWADFLPPEFLPILMSPPSVSPESTSSLHSPPGPPAPPL
jgi:MFS family permease